MDSEKGTSKRKTRKSSLKFVGGKKCFGAKFFGWDIVKGIRMFHSELNTTSG